MLKNWIKNKKNRKERLENENDYEEISTSESEIEINRSRSTISSKASSLSRVKRSKASLCFGSVSDSDTENSKDSKKEFNTSDKSCKNSKQEKKIKKRIYRTKSNAWDFFTKIDTTRTQCNICQKVFKNCGNTTNFLTHVKKQHEAEFNKQYLSDSDSEGLCSENSKLITSTNVCVADSEKKTSEKKSFQNLFKNVIPYDKNSKKKKDLDQKLAVMIARDFQPLSLVEDKGFREFINALNPKYNIISRKLLTYSILPECYERAKNNLKTLLRETHAVSLTIDGWTSNANDSYLGITCHFFAVTNILTLHSTTLDVILIEKDETANNLSQLIRNCLTDWEIFDKVNHIVTDNAANMKLTVELLNKKHFPCFAHSLNLVLKNAITKCNNNEVLSVITKYKNLVTFFHHSPKASRMLKEANKKLAEEGETVPCKLIQYVDTRWNTLYHMINSILDNHNGIKLIKLNDEYSELQILTKEEIQLTKQINMILEPFEQATKDISGEEYVSISLVIPCIKGIILKLETIHKTLSYPAALLFYEKIRLFIEEKLIHYEQRTIGKVATLIDPRFKKMGFRSQANYEEAVNMLQNLLAAQLRSSDQIEQNVNQTHSYNKTNNCSVAKPTGIFSFMEHSSQSSAANVDNIILTRNYLTCGNINLSEDPLHYLKNRHPEIFQIALKYLCTPGSSVPVERLFSTTGYIISERRNRLSPKNVKILSFLNKNYKLVF